MKLQTKLTASIGLIVFFCISAIFVGIAYRTEKQIMHELKKSASIMFHQLLITRSWVADHGGIYVEKVEGVQSNPFLNDPDIKTDDGRIFTKRNPALVVRELSKYAKKLGLFYFHMTSLNLLNPFNKPDEFEVKALKEFAEKNVSELFHTEIRDGKKYFRYMAPLYTTKNCLQCHAVQGYKVGDVRGGLSIFIPMGKANLEIKKSRWLLLLSGIMVILFVEAILYILLNRMVLRPISSLTSATKRLRAGDYGVRLESVADDEIGDLVRGFHEMKETIESRTRISIESEERYRSLSETAKDAIVSVNFQGDVTLFNKAAEKMFLYSQEEIMGKDITTLMPEEYKDPHRSAFKEYIETRRPKVIGKCVELVGRRKDGEEFPLEISISSYELGDRLNFSGIMRDLTERKQMEASFLQAEKLSSIGGLVAGVAHEINNPLTGIMGYSELLLENEDLDDDLKGDLEKIRSEAERSARIVKGLLTFAREHKPEKLIIQINDVMESTISLVRHQLELKGINIEKKLAPGLKKVLGDPHQLQQVFINILNNGVHALEEGGGKDALINVETRQEDKTVQIVISNNGPGIRPEIMKRIFDPFFTTKEVGKGTGLGLSIVFGIIQEHHGVLEARNMEPDGVCFTISMPQAVV